MRRVNAFVTRRIRTIVIAGVGAGAIAVAGLTVPASAAQSPDPGAGVTTPDIVGGHEVDLPHTGMADLQVFRGADDPLHHTCGAVLVTRQWAATTAHCVTEFGSSAPMQASLFHLRIGSTSRTTGGVLVGLTAILVNADWAWRDGGPGITVGDIAMLKLDTYVGMQPYEVAPEVRIGPTTYLLGWGATEPDGSGGRPDDLQQLETRLLRPTLAQCAAVGIGDDELCVDDPLGTNGPCRGDSGGPALQQVPGTGGRNRAPARFAVVGLTVGSAPGPCGAAPSVYTSTAKWRSWMYQVIATGVVPPAVAPTGTDGGPARHGDTVTPSRRWVQWHGECVALRACAA